MTVLVSGSSGLVGAALLPALHAQGREPVRLVRPGAGTRGGVVWDPASDQADWPAMEGAEALVHLAGASIADGRWSPRRKQVLRASRVDATRRLVAGLARLQRPPRVLVSASAVGIYGDRGGEVLTEQSPAGGDFLARLAQAWEAEAQAAEGFGVRVVRLRFGMILARDGGALPRLLRLFRRGLGGRLGSGEQWMSWIALPDIVRIVLDAVAGDDLRGPLNAVAPVPVTNAGFTRALAGAVHRPALLPAPAWALRLALGEMADGLLLASQRALPARLAARGFAFQYPTLPAALAALLAAARRCPERSGHPPPASEFRP